MAGFRAETHGVFCPGVGDELVLCVALSPKHNYFTCDLSACIFVLVYKNQTLLSCMTPMPVADVAVVLSMAMFSLLQKSTAPACGMLRCWLHFRYCADPRVPLLMGRM